VGIFDSFLNSRSPDAAQPLDVTPDQLRRLFEINTFAPINLTRLVVPDTIERRWGRIIFISTSLGTMLEPGHVACGMTKASGEAFIAALATSIDFDTSRIDSLPRSAPKKYRQSQRYKTQVRRPSVGSLRFR
jgi:NAD(P)-dependent dehydrogenase (short-subunit alcohol dehydrogenase family)